MLRLTYSDVTWIQTLGKSLWRWRWAIALNAFLLSPLFLYELNVGQGGPDKTLLFLLPASVLWLLAVQVGLRRLWLSHAVLAPFYLFVAADLYVIVEYQTRLSSSMLLVIIENIADARSYLKDNVTSVFGALGVLAAFYVLGLRGVRHLQLQARRLSRVSALGALVLLYGGVNFRVGGPLSLLGHDRSSPFGVIPQGFLAYSVYRHSMRQAEQARSFVFGATRTEGPSEAETYVLVIGESSRRDHWGIYGYSRNTTPHLIATENVVKFDDVLSQASVTNVSVPLILTRGTIVESSRTASEKSIVSVFREIGFRTYWLSTQQRDPFTGAINRYSGEAQTERFYERRQDGVLVKAIRETLAENASKNAKLFFVVHTMGSHFTYASRYPKGFSVFDTRDPALSSRERLVNAYDNTILYTDYILSEIIRVLRERPGRSALWYVSDHGENLKEDSRNLYGHFYNNEFDIPIPMLFWYSREFAAGNAAKVSALLENAGKPLNTRAVFYSLVDMAGIHLPDSALPRLSVFSPAIQKIRRMCTSNPGVTDFDQWLEQRGLRQRQTQNERPSSPIRVQ